MIYEFRARVAVESYSGDKSYLQVISASTEHSYPYTVPSAEIEVVATDGYTDYIACVDFDDIVRLQVAIKYSSHEQWVYKDIFEGRIVTPKAQWGNGSTATFLCLGHAHEASYKVVIAPKTFDDTTDSRLIAMSFNATEIARTQVICPTTTTFTTAYTIDSYKKNIKDVFADLENISGYTYYFETKCYYTSKHLLDRVEIEYKPFSSTATNQYKVINGTPRLLSADFEMNGEELSNYIVVVGGEPTGGGYYAGISYDQASWDRYGARMLSTTDTNLESNAMCSKYSAGTLALTKDLKRAGTVELMGTPEAKIGDLVQVYIDKLKIQGAMINYYLRVMRVSHQIGEGFTTSLEFGVAKKGPEEYTAEFYRKNRIINSQFFKEAA